jgi:hypothetical protein
VRTVVIYESMFGNTHIVADHIAEGLLEHGDVEVVTVGEATPEVISGADLVVVGGPTHVHGLSRDSTRADAVHQAEDPDNDLHLDPDAEGEGLREWFESLTKVDGVRAAAFDTRVDMSPLVTGRASKGIAKRLRHHGFQLVADPESFLVDKETHLVAGEEDRAQAWGAQLGAAGTS